ncbi:MAG: YciI family protein [Betaproteobacteria bacterium]
MRFMIFVKGTPTSEAGVMPSQELLEAMGKYNEELVAAGIMRDGGGLHPSSKGVRVTFSGKDRTVRMGPFANTSELVAGYWIWTCKSLEEAISWVKRAPNPMPESSEIEIRQFYEMEDFAPSK